MIGQNRYNIRPYGLGIIITQLSFLLATARPAVAVVRSEEHTSELQSH